LLAITTLLAVSALLAVSVLTIAAVLAVILTIVAVVLAIVIAVATTSIASVAPSVSAVTAVSTIAAVTSITATSSSHNKPNTIILRPPLRNRHKYRLMITRTRHGTRAIIPRGESLVQLRAQHALAIAVIVDALEEDKRLRVERLLGRGVAANVLHREVRVALHDAVDEVLRGGVVGFLRIGEGAGDEIVDAHGEGYGGVLGDSFAVAGGDDDGGDHLIGGGDVAHGDAVAGAALDLEAVC